MRLMAYMVIFMKETTLRCPTATKRGGTALKHDHDVGYVTCVEIASRAWFRAMATLDRPHVSPAHETQDAATSLLCGLGPVKQQWLHQNAGSLESWANNYYSSSVSASLL